MMFGATRKMRRRPTTTTPPFDASLPDAHPVSPVPVPAPPPTAVTLGKAAASDDATGVRGVKRASAIGSGRRKKRRVLSDMPEPIAPITTPIPTPTPTPIPTIATHDAACSGNSKMAMTTAMKTATATGEDDSLALCFSALRVGERASLELARRRSWAVPAARVVSDPGGTPRGGLLSRKCAPAPTTVAMAAAAATLSFSARRKNCVRAHHADGTGTTTGTETATEKG